MRAYFKTFKKRPLIALHLGLNELRLLQLKRQGPDFHIEKMLVQPLSKTRPRPENKPSWEEVENDLQTLLTRAQLKDIDVALALPSSAVFKKQIELPLRVKENELVEEVKQQLSYYFPGGPDHEIHFDYKTHYNSEGQSSCLLFAARKDEFQSQLSLFEKMGLRLRIADIDIYALARAGTWHYFRRNRLVDAAAFLDLSWPLSSFLILSREEILFHHQWLVEPNSVENSLSEIETWRQQVKQAWQIYHAQHPQLRVPSLGLAGEIAALDQLAILLQETCPLPIEVMRPFKESTHASQVQTETIHSLSPRFLLCYGLALRGLD